MNWFHILFVLMTTGCISIQKPAESGPQERVYFATTTYEPTTTGSSMRGVQEKMIASLLPHVGVGLLVNDPAEFGEYTEAVIALGATSAELANFTELDIEHSDIWMRDYLINVDYRITGPTKQITNVAHSYGYSGPVPTSGKAIVDFDFDGWGYEPQIAPLVGLGYYDVDDAIAPGMASALNVPVITSSLIAEGGALTSDGHGTLAYSYQALHQRQPTWTQAQIEAELKRVTGARKVLSPPFMHPFDGQPIVNPPMVVDGQTLQLFGVNHIDETMAFAPSLAGESCASTVLVEVLDLAYVTNDAEMAVHNALQADADFWRAATDVNGVPFCVVEMPDPGMLTRTLTGDDATWQYIGLFTGSGLQGYDPEGGTMILPATYMNFVVSNGVVLLSAFDLDGTNQSLHDRDDAAVDAISRVYPGYEIVQIDTRDLETDGGGMHCITQEWRAPSL